jgi:hypothetical protein
MVIYPRRESLLHSPATDTRYYYTTGSSFGNTSNSSRLRFQLNGHGEYILGLPGVYQTRNEYGQLREIMLRGCRRQPVIQGAHGIQVDVGHGPEIVRQPVA